MGRMNRARTAELMDDPALDAGEHGRALGALNRANRLLGVDAGLYACADEVAGGGAFSILDLGAGGGGFFRHAAAQNPWNGTASLIALDRSTVALRHARRLLQAPLPCIAADARAIPLADNRVDVVTCSLLLHHFDEADAVEVLREAARVARRGVVVVDLSRSALAWGLTWMTTRLISRSRVFHVDGPKSVRAAFKAAELADLARRAGLQGAHVRARFPFRLVMIWKKGAA